MKIPTSARKKLYMILGGGLIVLALMFFFVIKPISDDLTIIHGEIDSQNQVLDQLLLETMSAEYAKSDFSKIGSRAGEIERLFPSRVELVSFVERLESIADTFDNDFSIVITDAQDIEETSGRPPEKEAYQTVPGLREVEVIPYNILLTGDFEAIVQFLQTLENQPFYSEIDTMSFRSQTTETGDFGNRRITRSGLVEANLRAAFYALKEE